jgi:hypothetical protein
VHNNNSDISAHPAVPSEGNNGILVGFRGVGPIKAHMVYGCSQSRQQTLECSRIKAGESPPSEMSFEMEHYSKLVS